MENENIIDTLLGEGNTEESALQYSQDDENRSRNQAADILKSRNIKQSVQETQGYGKAISEMKSSYDKTIKELTDKVTKLEGGYQSTASTVDTLSTRLTSDDIVRAEQDLGKDEVLAPYYDQNLVRKTFLANLSGDKQRGVAPKELTPYESLAIAKFYDLAKENAELKSKISKRQQMQGMVFDTEINPYAKVDRASNVKDSRSAKQVALEYARELDGN